MGHDFKEADDILSWWRPQVGQTITKVRFT
jgi:hypothetical protein